MSAKFIINNKRYIEAYDNTTDMSKPYIRTKKAIKNHSIIDKNYYIKMASQDNDGDKTNNAKIYSKKKKKSYYLVANIIPKKDFIYQTDPSTGEVFSGLYKYAVRRMTQKGNNDYITDNQLLQKNKDELTNIRPIGSAYYAFFRCCNMIDLKGVETTWDTSQITSMENMFYNFGIDRRKRGSNNEWIYEKVELDLSNWDFSNVTNMHMMFQGVQLKELLLPPEGIVAPKLTSIRSMFTGVPLTTIPMITTKNVKDMGYLFQGTKTFTTMPQWDTSSVVTMERMFQQCGSYNGTGSNPRPPYGGLKKVPSLNTSNVVNFESTFSGCYALEEIGELDTSKADDMTGMFLGCASLPEEFPWTIDCSGITKLDYSKSTLVDLKGMQSMFSGSSVKKVRLRNLKSSLKKSERDMASYLGTSTVIYEN